MYGCESWTMKKAECQRLMLSNCGAEMSLESPLNSKEIKPVNPKGNQPWIFIGRTDAEAEAPILWPPDGKSWLIGKDPDAEKDWGQEEKAWHRMRWLDSITKSMGMNLRKLKEVAKDREMSHAVIQGVTKSRAQLSDWTRATGVQAKIVSLFYFLDLVLIRMKTFRWSGFWNTGLSHEPLKKKDFFCIPRTNICLI